MTSEMKRSPRTAASIIIPAKNESQHLGSCLEKVLGQDYGAPFEVIVIDSGSTDDTVDIVKGFDVRLHQIRPEEFGHGRTRNLGASLAEGQYLVFLAAHAIPVHSGWLGHLIAELEPDDVAGAYGRQVAWQSANPMEQFFLDYLYGEQSRVQTMTNGPLDMYTTLFSNVNCAIKRSIWESYPFSETIVMSEDQVWSRQVLEAGYKIVYSSEAAVYHSHNYSLSSAFRRFFDSGWSSEESYLPRRRGTTATMFGGSLDYFFREIGFLLRSRNWRWIPYAGLYDGSKFAGLVAGRWHRLLPEGWKRRFSSYRGTATPAASSKAMKGSAQ